MKIISFELENVKRVALVRMAPAENGLTVIGGKNAAGKTSVLDGIVYALGGEKYRPSNLQREGGMAAARIRIELSGGIVVERKGKNAALHVTDATGRRRGQTLLNDFIDELALNLPKFLHARDDEKAEVLLRTLGIADKLAELDVREKQAYDKRHDFGVIVDQKRKFANELVEYPDAPETPISAAELVAESQAILVRNAKRAEARRNLADLVAKAQRLAEEGKALQEAVQRKAAEAEKVAELLIEAQKHPIDEDESTAELERKIANIEEINAHVRANADKDAAEREAEEHEAKLAELTAEVEAVRKERRDLLNGAKMPLPDLKIGKNDKGRPVLTYKGKSWDCMSTMEQYRVAAAIVRVLKPECGFILLDGLECFDRDQMKAFDEWLTGENLQAICTRVGDTDCSIVIEDGYAVQEGVEAAPAVPDENDAIPMEDDDQEKEW